MLQDFFHPTYYMQVLRLLPMKHSRTFCMISTPTYSVCFVIIVSVFNFSISPLQLQKLNQKLYNGTLLLNIQ